MVKVMMVELSHTFLSAEFVLGHILGGTNSIVRRSFKRLRVESHRRLWPYEGHGTRSIVKNFCPSSHFLKENRTPLINTCTIS